MKSHRAFILIELLFVVFVIGILAAVAIPAYQDYTIRARISEGLVLTEGVREAIGDYYAHTGRFPHDNAAAGLPAPEGYRTTSIAGLTVENGAIHIDYHGPVGPAEGTLTLLPVVGAAGAESGSVQWLCGEQTPLEGMIAIGENRTSIADRYLPSSCR